MYSDLLCAHRKTFRKHCRAVKKTWKNGGSKEGYQKAIRFAKDAVYLAKSKAKQEVRKGSSPSSSDLFCLANQMRWRNLDVQGEKPVPSDAGELCLNDRGLDKPHRKSTMRASQIFELDPDSLADVYPVESLAPICHLSWWSSPSRWWNVVRLMLHPRNAESLWWWMGQQIRDPVEKIPTELEESIIVALYKDNGVALERRNCRCLKLPDLVKNGLERVSGNVTPQEVCTDDIQFSFMSDCSTTNAMLIVCQLQEKFHVVNKTMNMAFVNLEKAFNRVSRRVIWWAFRKLGLEQWLVGLIWSMYENASTRVCIGCNLSEEFIVKRGVHQGSCLSPYCSSRFWKPSFKSFEQDIPGKTGMPMTKSSSLNRWMKCKRSWSSGYLAWKERYFESTWAKPRSWYLARISICFRSPAKSRVPCVFPVSTQTPSSVEVVPDTSTRYTVMSLAL